ncbi:thiamine diphosphokinase [Clostridium sp.]|uniref:thiamine diphosphokinase n=1 Tax=Clostridium sp. TaxID=1506 RepID=UPI0034647E9B
MKIVIVGGGKEPSPDLLTNNCKSSDLIIAADRGAQYLSENNIYPNILLGDFDSIDEEILEEIKKKNINMKVYPKEKDFTDSELALNIALEYNPKEIVLLGCTGTRMDHVFGNIGLLNKCLERNIKGKIIDDNNIIFLVNESTTLKDEGMKYIGFQGFRHRVRGFNIRDAKYDLYDHDLTFGECITVSNEFIKDTMDISFNEGVVMVIYSKD